MTRRRPQRIAAAPEQPGQLNLLTAAGALLVLVAAAALISYSLTVIPLRAAAAQGPPEQFRAAATQQAGQVLLPHSPTPVPGGGEESLAARPGATPTLLIARPASQQEAAGGSEEPEANSGAGGIPAWVDVDYWISIPALALEAPVMGFRMRRVEVDGMSVQRLPVPNAYVVGWDENSSPPGTPGNTVMTGHNNLYGAVFADLSKLAAGSEIAIWSDAGVFSYYVSQIVYLEEEGQPLDVRFANAQWLGPTSDDRLTLVSCWPRPAATHRILVIATR